MRNSDRLLIVSVTLLTVYFVLSVIIPDLTSPIVIVYNWFLDMSLVFGYLGAFLISFIGNLIVLFPIPYMLASFFLGGLTHEITGQFLFNPWLVGIISGLGATFGEMTSYLFGYGGRRLVDESQRNSFRDYIDNHPRATPFFIWFLAISPIPDDFLIIPLGAAKYPWWKVAIPQFIGKSMFMIAAAWLGRISLGVIGDLQWSTNPASIESRFIEFLALLTLIIGLYVLVRIDWKKMITKEGEEEVPQ